jgi:hypothetical protein
MHNYAIEQHLIEEISAMAVIGDLTTATTDTRLTTVMKNQPKQFPETALGAFCAKYEISLSSFRQNVRLRQPHDDAPASS